MNQHYIIKGDCYDLLQLNKIEGVFIEFSVLFMGNLLLAIKSFNEA